MSAQPRRRRVHLTLAERREVADTRRANRKLNRWGPFTNPEGGDFSLSVADALARSPRPSRDVRAAPPWEPLSEMTTRPTRAITFLGRRTRQPRKPRAPR